MFGFETLDKGKKSPPPKKKICRLTVDQQSANTQPSTDYCLLSYVKFFHQLLTKCQQTVYFVIFSFNCSFFSCPGHPFIIASADGFTQVKYVITIIITLL